MASKLAVKIFKDLSKKTEANKGLLTPEQRLNCIDSSIKQYNEDLNSQYQKDRAQTNTVRKATGIMKPIEMYPERT